MNSLLNLSIEEIKKGLESKDFSCVELTKAFVDRTKETDDKVKSFITFLEEDALKKAKEVDEKIGKGEQINLLEGVCAGIKDVIVTKDTLSTAGSNMLKKYVPSFDATCIKRLKEKGYINLGKTNCDAFAHGASTEYSDFFVTKNPWDLNRVPGGSSGGSASAVAARQTVFSLGTDTGGSVRHPAGFCGVSGLKPTYGRISRYGLMSMTSSTDCPGIFAKNSRDIAVVLDNIAGHDNKDASSSKQSVVNSLSSLKLDNIKGTKIGIPKEYFIEGIDIEVDKLVKKAIKELENKGAEIIEISLPNTAYAIAVYYIITPAELSSNLSRYDGIKYGFSAEKDLASDSEVTSLLEMYEKTRQHGFGEENKRRIMLGTYALSSGYYDQYYNKALKVRTLIKNDFVEAFKKVDFILTPTAPTPAFKVGENSNPLDMYLQDIFMSAVSLAGLPAISVPCGFIKTEENKNLPVGIQLIGNYFNEAELLNLSYNYEEINKFYLNTDFDSNLL